LTCPQADDSGRANGPGAAAPGVSAEQREVARSLAKPKAGSATSTAPADEQRATSRKQVTAKRKAELWREPRVRERRTELAVARARLLSAARRRSDKEAP
jgi:hypothetical protein